MQNLKKQRSVSNNNNINNNSSATTPATGVRLLIGRKLKVPVVVVDGLLVAEAQDQ